MLSSIYIPHDSSRSQQPSSTLQAWRLVSFAGKTSVTASSSSLIPAPNSGEHSDTMEFDRIDRGMLQNLDTSLPNLKFGDSGRCRFYEPTSEAKIPSWRTHEAASELTGFSNTFVVLVSIDGVDNPEKLGIRPQNCALLIGQLAE